MMLTSSYQFVPVALQAVCAQPAIYRAPPLSPITWLPGKTRCFGRGVNDGCVRIASPVLDLTLPAAIVHDGRVSTAERRRIAMMGSRELGRATMRRSMIVLLVALVASLAF